MARIGGFMLMINENEKKLHINHINIHYSVITFVYKNVILFEVTE